jgi:putative DNA primase/helicase
VIVAFNAGNLKRVATAIRECFPGRRIVIAGDNDASVEGNPGATKAKEAAKAIGAELMLPPEPGDWNDFLTKEVTHD